MSKTVKGRGYNEISAEFERYIYSSLLVRCTDAAALPVVRDKLKNDRRIQLDDPRWTTRPFSCEIRAGPIPGMASSAASEANGPWACR